MTNEGVQGRKSPKNKNRASQQKGFPYSLSLLKEQKNRKAWFSFSCKDEKHLSSGETIEEAIKPIAQEENVLAIGANCSAPANILAIIKAIKKNTAKPIIVYPNSGEVWDAKKKSWLGNSNPEEFAQMAKT